MATATKPKKAKKKKKAPTLSPAEKAFAKLQKDHRSAIRAIFRFAGFHRVTGVADKEFTFQGQTGDIDDVFVFENVFVVAEYTCRQASGVGEHLKSKKILYDKISAAPVEFIKFLSEKFPAAAEQLEVTYHPTQIVLKILYCSRYDFEPHYKENVPGPVYMDYPAARYFLAVSDAIKRSSRFELFHFLGVDSGAIGSGGKIQVSAPSNDYSGSILPEAHSHFEEGYKIVTFYADPDALLKTAYVLRKDGWRDSLNLYQRMISKAKIEDIRAYLKREKRVFINNIIVTLPPEVKPLNDKLETIDTKTLTQTAPVTIRLPDSPNSIGIIDGQHRVFAYHETANDDAEIAQLRVQQNLLVTGIIYPEGLSSFDREKFEARLFLEINSTQTNAKSQLKQAIGVVIDPFSSESIATRILTQLGKTGPLAGHIEQYFFDSDKLKTASIVSYGLKPLVKTSGTDSLFAIWEDPRKDALAAGTDPAALQDYMEFCVSIISRVLIAIRKNLSSGRWTTASKVPGRVLATTYVNSFLITLRLLIEQGKSVEEDHLTSAFSGIDGFDFSAYHSSQYKRMAEKIVETHFPS